MPCAFEAAYYMLIYIPFSIVKKNTDLIGMRNFIGLQNCCPTLCMYMHTCRIHFILYNRFLIYIVSNFQSKQHLKIVYFQQQLYEFSNTHSSLHFLFIVLFFSSCYQHTMIFFFYFFSLGV